MIMAKRKTISKKTRFEVFKRDSFTCQYCGRMAPDVVLEIDHIDPINNGGTNDIMNLITSCFDCNRGKGKRKLTAREEIKKQQEQLKEINEKRTQLEMLLQWKKELDNFENEQVDKIEEHFSKNTGYYFSEHGKNQCKKAIKKYGFEEVFESTKISIEQCFDTNDEKSISTTFNYIWKICANREYQKKNPMVAKVNYLVKIAKNRLRYLKEYDLKKYLREHLTEENFDYVKEIFKYAESWTELINEMQEYFESEG
jgi:hypothetical protein